MDIITLALAYVVLPAFVGYEVWQHFRRKPDPLPEIPYRKDVQDPHARPGNVTPMFRKQAS